MNKVMIVEKEAVPGRRLRMAWEKAGFEVLLATDFSRAVMDAVRWQPDFIMLNFEGCETEGQDVSLQLRSQALTCRIPVIFRNGELPKGMPSVLLSGSHEVVSQPLANKQWRLTVPELFPIPS